MRPALFLLVLGVAACATGREASEPPFRFEHDVEAAVRFSTASADLCGGAAHEANVKVEACVKSARVVLPNPCAWPDDAYAQLACHELGHRNGWPADHGP